MSHVGSQDPKHAEYVLSYWRGSLENPKHVLFMRYEEMKEEPRVQIKRLADFLRCPFTKEEEEWVRGRDLRSLLFA